jgi:hypothetical protein
VQVAPLKLGKLSSKQPAITPNVSAMANNLGVSQVIHRRTSTASSCPFVDEWEQKSPRKK